MPTHPTGLKNTRQNLPPTRLSKFRFAYNRTLLNTGRLSALIRRVSVLVARIALLATVEPGGHLSGKPTIRPSDEKPVYESHSISRITYCRLHKRAGQRYTFAGRWLAVQGSRREQDRPFRIRLRRWLHGRRPKYPLHRQVRRLCGATPSPHLPAPLRRGAAVLQ